MTFLTGDSVRVIDGLISNYRDINDIGIITRDRNISRYISRPYADGSDVEIFFSKPDTRGQQYYYATQDKLVSSSETKENVMTKFKIGDHIIYQHTDPHGTELSYQGKVISTNETVSLIYVNANHVSWTVFNSDLKHDTPQSRLDDNSETLDKVTETIIDVKDAQMAINKFLSEDVVLRPTHYSTGMPEGVEVIDIIRSQKADYLHGNVLKYILRWKFKNGVEDLRKAQVYLGWLIEQEETK